jgi:parallel beta-helix repeat protein
MGIYLAPGADHNFMIMNQVSAYNEGVRVERSYKNTLRANSISGCGWKGLFLLDGGNHDLPAPAINSLTEAGVAGSTCSYCLVDVFSDPGSQGLIYEGLTVADGSGNYSFAKRLMGPNVTVSVTDLDGNTSEFSNPTGITWTWFKNFLPLILR